VIVIAEQEMSPRVGPSGKRRRSLRKLISRSQALIYGELRARLFIVISSMDEFLPLRAQAEQLNACTSYVCAFGFFVIQTGATSAS
jgi:hypothetical protein